MSNVVMNATGYGIIGITNLASQTGTVGTILGSAIIIGLLCGAFMSAHSWNTKGWLYRLLRWLFQSIGENVAYGLGTTLVAGCIYYVGNELSKFTGSNPKFLYDMAVLVGEGVAVIAFLAILGWASKPMWTFAKNYAAGTPVKKAARVVAR